MPTVLDIIPLKTRTNVSLEIDSQILDKAYEDERIGKLLRVLRRASILSIDEGCPQAKITTRLNSITRYSDAPTAVVEAIDRLYNFVTPDAQIPWVKMSHAPIDKASHRYGMYVEVQWPECYTEAAQFATRQMQQFAAGINLKNGGALNRANAMVYVAADAEQGLSVQTNPLGGCGIETSGDDYGHERPLETVSLWQHNLYAPEQQLACLVGAVAFAKANSHLEG